MRHLKRAGQEASSYLFYSKQEAHTVVGIQAGIILEVSDYAGDSFKTIFLALEQKIQLQFRFFSAKVLVEWVL